MIQSCIFWLLLAKQNAAPTVGVLQGMPGVITPIYAMIKQTHPAVNHNARLILCPTRVPLILHYYISYLDEKAVSTNPGREPSG